VRIKYALWESMLARPEVVSILSARLVCVNAAATVHEQCFRCSNRCDAHHIKSTCKECTVESGQLINRAHVFADIENYVR